MTVPDSKQLLFSKWTAVRPRNKEKHFVVRRVFEETVEGCKSTFVEIDAVISKRIRRLSLQELRDPTRWARGWGRDPEPD